jgi:hypothetical protein
MRRPCGGDHFRVEWVAAVRMKPGTWLVLTIVGGAVLLALAALRFRAPMPVRATQAVTQPR